MNVIVLSVRPVIRLVWRQYNSNKAVGVLYLTYTTSDWFVCNIYTGYFLCSPSQLRYKSCIQSSLGTVPCEKNGILIWRPDGPQHFCIKQTLIQDLFLVLRRYSCSSPCAFIRSIQNITLKSNYRYMVDTCMRSFYIRYLISLFVVLSRYLQTFLDFYLHVCVARLSLNILSN